MSRIRLTADSTVDLSDTLVEECGVEIIPLHITMGEKTYADGIDLTPQMVTDYFKENGTLAKSAAVSVGEYQEIFEKYAARGEEVIHINISAEMSACHQNALLAAKEVPGIYPVDSRNLSTGSGYLVMLAKKLIDEGGRTAAEIAEELRRATPLVEASFVLDTLTYLYKGGRCSAVAALGANMLKIHPCIRVKDGTMGLGKKYRGNMGRVVAQYVADSLEGRDDLDPSLIFITHTAYCDPEMIQAACDSVAKVGVFERVEKTVAGCTITAHCGPNTLGVLFAHKPETKA
ncbi:MAG: DegV family protein [Christensenellales bacterium]|jgi:DegV family protein with EDD domain